MVFEGIKHSEDSFWVEDAPLKVLELADLDRHFHQPSYGGFWPFWAFCFRWVWKMFLVVFVFGFHEFALDFLLDFVVADFLFLDSCFA
ncbi:hypothetical protein Goari_025026, partial [Gossypium aridum]|nr:hypothetical protein [Gossypium aridum]